MMKFLSLLLISVALVLSGCYHHHGHSRPPGHDRHGPGNSENAPGHNKHDGYGKQNDQGQNNGNKKKGNGNGN